MHLLTRANHFDASFASYVFAFSVKSRTMSEIDHPINKILNKNCANCIMYDVISVYLPGNTDMNSRDSSFETAVALVANGTE